MGYAEVTGCTEDASSTALPQRFPVSRSILLTPLFRSLQLSSPILNPLTTRTHPQETSKKRTRRTVKQQRGIVGAPLELIKDRRSQRPEAREAARKEAIAKGKEKKATAESKKKAEKAKSAAGAARGQPGRIQSKMGSKGVPNKATGKTR